MVPRDLTKTDRTCPKCSHTFGAVANHCICPECKHRFFAVDPSTLPPAPGSIFQPTLSPEYEAALDSFDAQLAAAIGAETDARYSAYECDSDGIPIDNLDEIAIHGFAVITAPADEFWGGAESLPFRSELLTNPTWLDLCVVLHSQIQVTRDLQHVFLEGVSPTGESFVIDGRTVLGYELDLGS